MKCKRCDGDGVIIYYDYQYADKEVCPDCDGNGIVEPLTEQEYIQTCTTEQLAEVLYRFYRDGRNDELQRYISINEKSFVDWLKQLHREE